MAAPPRTWNREPGESRPAAEQSPVQNRLDQIYDYISSLELFSPPRAPRAQAQAAASPATEPPTARSSGGMADLFDAKSLSHSVSGFLTGLGTGDCSSVSDFGPRCTGEPQSSARDAEPNPIRQEDSWEEPRGARQASHRESPPSRSRSGLETLSPRAERVPRAERANRASALPGSTPSPFDVPRSVRSVPREDGNRPPSGSPRSLNSARGDRPMNSLRLEYDADPEDLLDQHVAYYLKHHPEAMFTHNLSRKHPGVYLINGRDVRVEWQHSESGGQGCLMALDGPLRQPFADYMEHTENNIEYDVQGIGVDTSLHSIPREKRMSFHDTHKVYSRLEAMKVAKEQALVREKAADYTKDGREVPRELMSKYKKTIALKLDPAGKRKVPERPGERPEQRAEPERPEIPPPVFNGRAQAGNGHHWQPPFPPPTQLGLGAGYQQPWTSSPPQAWQEPRYQLSAPNLFQPVLRPSPMDLCSPPGFPPPLPAQTPALFHTWTPTHGQV
ncbi:unnamed protein product [Effrenium voratum]|nr:unnamed protein product [Effrenium voratum]